MANLLEEELNSFSGTHREVESGVQLLGHCKGGVRREDNQKSKGEIGDAGDWFCTLPIANRKA